ncbi:cation:proton antiporter regulatory subunit, partial [Nostoc sp. CHAB 5715]|uniref:cation:proton antiporter regulatory subunit n=1 Tax=Nostoc sp. CHAB 5715 TaxID=2780400 RepID=UPI0034D31E54|nr:hypothetical protein [Nostoc sp. CHAB 5715]
NQSAKLLWFASSSKHFVALLQLRNRYGLNLLAVSQDGKFIINPDATKRLERGSAMVVIGCNKDINRLPI